VPVKLTSAVTVPLEPPDFHHCEAALGFSELGMFGDAEAELERIDPFNRALPEVLRVRAAVYHGTANWDDLRAVALKLTRLEPANVQWPLSLAYATRRAASIEFARDILLAAKEQFPSEPIISFNLACYCCQLGDMDAAKEYLKQAFAIDLNLRQAALDDQDLEPLWNFLNEVG
jgi:tetratricopeptide (TPR) repeat protein